MSQFPKPLDTLTQAELRARLELRREAIQDHISGLRSEMTLADVTVGHRPVFDHIRERPWLSLGAALAAGALVGLVTRLAGRKAPEESPLYEAFRRAQAQDLLDDAALRVARGEDTERALTRALRSRAPVVYVETERREPPPETTTLDFLLKTALGFGTKTALDMMTRRFVGEPEFFKGMEETSAPEGVGA